MKKLFRLILLLVIFLNQGVQGQDDPDNRMQWWQEARFGMFIHWGLYAVPAGEWNGKTGYGEWIRTSAQIPLEVYDRFVPQMNPVGFNAEEWVKTAHDAGMKYIVITSKHHDGFCMFNTGQTDFNIMNTPFHRDPMIELAAACRKYGLKFCFYYSIMDWHHPDYLPRREWEKNRPAEGADYNRYVSYMKAQLKELLTRYGDIGVIWFDGEWESTWNQQRGLDLYKYCRSLQPAVLVNNRVGAGRIDWVGMTKPGMFGGDFGTPEQQIPAKGLPGTDWETCMTMNDHWGYNSHDINFKSSKEMIRMLTDIASKGGNYLLNVGPTAQGTFPRESTERLRDIGAWMKINGEAIYGTTSSPISETPWGRCTMKTDTSSFILYLHVFNWPADGLLRIQGCLNEPVRAYLLADREHKALKISQEQEFLVIQLPEVAPDTINSVVAVRLAGKPDFNDPPEIYSTFSAITDSLPVELKSSRNTVEIRYLISEKAEVVTMENLLYTHPLILSGECTVNARCFRNGKAVSGTNSRKYSVRTPSQGVVLKNPRPGLNYSYYEGEWDSVPDFSKLAAAASAITDSLTLSMKKRNENFGIRYQGYLKIEKNGMYRFILASDDGSKFYLDNTVAIDHDGLHAASEKTGEVALSPGFHPFKIDYVQRTGSAELKLFMESAEAEKVPVNKGMLFYE